MADFISLEAAIQFFNGWVDDLDKQINDSVNYPHLRSDYKVCKTQLLDCIHAIKGMPAADVVPWEWLERYADFFCAGVSMPEFVREAKMFYKGTNEAMQGGVIDV